MKVKIALRKIKSKSFDTVNWFFLLAV